MQKYGKVAKRARHGYPVNNISMFGVIIACYNIVELPRNEGPGRVYG